MKLYKIIIIHNTLILPPPIIQSQINKVETLRATSLQTCYSQKLNLDINWIISISVPQGWVIFYIPSDFFQGIRI